MMTASNLFSSANLSFEKGVLQVTEIRLLHLPNDDFAGPDVDAADPLSLVDHHALGNCIDSAAIEIGYSRRTQRGDSSAKASAQLFELQIHRHRGNGCVLIWPMQEEPFADTCLGPI